MTSRYPNIAIIGAGISGLISARLLRDAGCNVRVIEKSRGVGGRMATRRSGHGLRFDHGAQYFTVRDQAFKQYVDQWQTAGFVDEWRGEIVDLQAGSTQAKDHSTARFVAVPGMNAVCKHLAEGLDIAYQTRLLPPLRVGAKWHLQADDGRDLGEFDWVITTAPAPQSAELLAAAPHLQQQAAGTAMSGCWAAMLAFDMPLGLNFEGAFVHGSMLSWIAQKDSKTGRSHGDDGRSECWVLHASPDWTNQHIDDEAESVLPRLVDAFWEATHAVRQVPHFATAHRWRYAIPSTPLAERYLLDRELQIAACGDWCSGPRVEGAFLSGLALTQSLIATISV